MTSAYFHPGEREIQAETGTDTEEYEAMAAQAMTPELVGHEIAFIEGRTFSMAASIDSRGRPWASSLLATTENIFKVVDETTIDMRPAHVAGDPLWDNVADNKQLGVLFFDPSKRRRAKSLGNGTLLDDGTIRYRQNRYFGLCPKYIAKRTHQPQLEAQATPEPAEEDAGLSDRDIGQLKRSDTIFLASYHDGHGADATHRGGQPGFVRVIDPKTIEVPDYFGNMMFNTIGNLTLDNRLGLTDIDYATGRTIQVTGTATINREVDSQLHGDAERVIILTVDHVITSTVPVGTWSAPEASNFSHNYPGGSE